MDVMVAVAAVAVAAAADDETELIGLNSGDDVAEMDAVLRWYFLSH